MLKNQNWNFKENSEILENIHLKREVFNYISSKNFKKIQDWLLKIPYTE